MPPHLRRGPDAIDDGVGAILAKLRALDLEKNTIVFFTSDNGGPSFWKPRPEILDVIKAGTPLGARGRARRSIALVTEALPMGDRRQRLRESPLVVRQGHPL